MADLLIRPASDLDADAIAGLSNALLATTTVEWRDEPHTAASRLAWMDRHDLVLVALDADKLVGFAAYGEFRDRAGWPGYRFVVENTVHVRESHWGTAVGRRLMEALITEATTAGVHAMVAAVDSDNEGSIRFHERLGFAVVGRLSQVGAKHGRWLDLVLLERLLDDRPVPPEEI